MALARGTRLGAYQIESPIGAGGMGEVYKATDTRLERTVAIKVLLTCAGLIFVMARLHNQPDIPGYPPRGPCAGQRRRAARFGEQRLPRGREGEVCR